MAGAILDAHPDLHYYGYGLAAGVELAEADQDRLRDPDSLQTILAVERWVRESRPDLSRTSYALKHDAERDLGGYVSNGQLIAAMLLAGYQIKDTRAYNPRFAKERTAS